MKRASSESASSATPAKKPSTFNNTGGFTADSTPQHRYYLGEDNYAVRYVTKVNFSRQFLPSVCLLTETEWNQLQFIRKKISESCESLMFSNFLKKEILLEVSSWSPRTNLQMELRDVEVVISIPNRTFSGQYKEPNRGNDGLQWLHSESGETTWSRMHDYEL
ncbi:hypothetical protein AVEN_43975-1 [Araneus ventricosus]|uniref:Uncharacterized protein n=1 Tax=Araneus ventricosus TaxID=182803 RepID=A0A4Y2QXK8_ARAVE|nr:hypothetical protein AVEN_43975-1 [Araneus ventricosus]